MELHHQLPTNPLHLLDDFLSSLPKNVVVPSPASDHDGSSQDGTATTSNYEKHDLILRIASDLFGSKGSLLESALSLLEEHERFQSGKIKIGTNGTNDESDMTTSAVAVIRKIRARRSGRMAILIRKQQRRNDKSSSLGNGQYHKTVGNKRKDNMLNEYYLCLLGRDQLMSPHAFATRVNPNNCRNIQRRGMHCTCRSFYQKVKGGSNGSSISENGKRREIAKPESLNEVVVCKHLLASILMPHLLPWSDCTRNGEEVVDDREFAKLVMRASIG